MKSDLALLLGKKLDDVAVSPFIRSLHEKPDSRMIGDEFYMVLRKSGIAFIAPLDGHVSAIQLFARGREKTYEEFKGELPEGTKFTDSRRAVRERLGRPDASGGGAVDPILGKAPPWDRYDRKGYALHFQYSEGEDAIGLVSLMRPDAVPR